MALDLVSVPSPSEAGPPLKKRRLGWDVPDPVFLSQAARLQVQVASQLLQGILVASTQEWRLISSPENQGDSFCDGTLKGGKSEVKNPHDNGAKPVLQSSTSPLLQHKDDPDGHLDSNVGENLTSRYKILRKMGEGTFGRVLECLDLDSQEIVAIKIVRSAERYRKAAMMEIEVLHTLHQNDRQGFRGCVKMRRWFDYRNHICIVFEKLGPSLYDFLRANDYCPFPLESVQDFGRQLLESVAYMHCLSLIHTDLKPENVLLASADHAEVLDRKVFLLRSASRMAREASMPFFLSECFQNLSKQVTEMKQVLKSNRIKLIDFGSTTYDKECSFSTVSTRHYRAPEVILGCGWSYPCDIWSVACILVELCSGEVLFQTHKNVEHLAMMERVFGAIPSYVVRRSKGKAFKYFRHERSLDWPAKHTTRESVRAVERLPKLRDLVARYVDRVPSSFINLLERMFSYDPLNRLTAREALQHPFFKEKLWQ